MREDPAVLKGRSEPKSLWLVTNSPIRRSFISAEVGANELRVHLEIDSGDRERNLAVLDQLRAYRDVIEAETGELDFLEGSFRCKVVKRLPWEGKLLTHPNRHDEARHWFYANLAALRRGIQAVEPAVAAATE